VTALTFGEHAGTPLQHLPLSYCLWLAGRGWFRKRRRDYVPLRDALIAKLQAERAQDAEREEGWWLDARDNLRDDLDDRQRRSSGATTATRGTGLDECRS
jgi:hypothetical protein